MPLSSVVGAQSIVKPGVCTSSTRPASPYDGQVIYETDTDKTLVWNGSAWVFLSTSRSNPGGLDLVKAQTAFTTSSAVNVDSVFSTTYDEYQINIAVTSASANTGLNFRLRGGGTTQSGSDYYGYTTGTSPSNTSDNYASSGATAHVLIGLYGASLYHFAMVRISGVALAQKTVWRSEGYGFTTSGGNVTYQGGCNHNLATAYDGFTLLPGSGTMTGWYSVYGYVK